MKEYINEIVKKTGLEALYVEIIVDKQCDKLRVDSMFRCEDPYEAISKLGAVLGEVNMSCKQTFFSIYPGSPVRKEPTVGINVFFPIPNCSFVEKVDKLGEEWKRFRINYIFENNQAVFVDMTISDVDCNEDDEDY